MKLNIIGDNTYVVKIPSNQNAIDLQSWLDLFDSLDFNFTKSASNPHRSEFTTVATRK